MKKIIEKYRDVHEALKDNPKIELASNRNRYPKDHGHRVTGLRNHAIEKLVEERARKLVGNDGEPIGYSSDEKSLNKQ